MLPEDVVATSLAHTMLNKVRVLITGGAGFIGSHIVDGSLAAGHQVCVVDDLSTGRRDNVPASAEFIHGDIRDNELVHRIFSDFKPDVVSHHAAQVSVPQSFAQPDHDLSVNILGTLCLLDAAKKNRCRFVYAS